MMYYTLQVDLPSLKPRINQLVQPATDFLLGVCFPSGNLPSSLESSHTDRLVHWCHGAPGFVHLMAHAHKVRLDHNRLLDFNTLSTIHSLVAHILLQTYGNQYYLDAAVKCGEVVWERGLLRKGYGLCHGVSGNAYTFLQLYQLTGKVLYFNRAVRFAEWCVSSAQRECRVPDRPYSLFEGLAGVTYFYVDLLALPDSATFPALELPQLQT